MPKELDFNYLITQKALCTNISGMEENSDVITMVFECFYNRKFVVSFFHDQDCCEDVSVDEVHGDVEDLLNTPLLSYEESSSDEPPLGCEPVECDTWTFYTFRTIKGTVTVRWFGTSNGYYSTDVTCKVSELK